MARHLVLQNFVQTGAAAQLATKALRKEQLVAKRHRIDVLTGQLEMTTWFLTEAGFSLRELRELNFKSDIIRDNLRGYIQAHVVSPYQKLAG